MLRVTVMMLRLSVESVIEEKEEARSMGGGTRCLRRRWKAWRRGHRSVSFTRLYGHQMHSDLQLQGAMHYITQMSAVYYLLESGTPRLGSGFGGGGESAACQIIVWIPVRRRLQIRRHHAEKTNAIKMDVSLYVLGRFRFNNERHTSYRQELNTGLGVSKCEQRNGIFFIFLFEL